MEGVRLMSRRRRPFVTDDRDPPATKRRSQPKLLARLNSAAQSGDLGLLLSSRRTRSVSEQPVPVAAEEPAITAEELAMRNFLAATAAFAGDLDPAAAAEQAEVSPGVVSHAADEVGSNGETALWVAAENGDLPEARAQLERGADVDQADFQGQTPLWAAAYKGHLDMLQW